MNTEAPLGFTFAGRHNSEFDLNYTPAVADRSQNIADFETKTQKNSYRHGQDRFGYSFKAREFKVDCYYEYITEDTIEKMLLWVTPDASGYLIFDERPYVRYYVNVSKKSVNSAYPVGEDEDGGLLYSGTFVIYFEADIPFGCLTINCLPDGDAEAQAKRQHPSLIYDYMMPDNDYTQMGSFIIYNPGNFETDTVIQIAGTASNGVTIKNKTNGDICKLKSLPDNGNYLEITSETGRIQMLPSYPDAVVYNYHDYGYIRLAPSWPVYDDITVTFTSGSNEITSSDFTFTKSFEGYYLFIDGGWYRISATYE